MQELPGGAVLLNDCCELASRSFAQVTVSVANLHDPFERDSEGSDETVSVRAKLDLAVVSLTIGSREFG